MLFKLFNYIYISHLTTSLHRTSLHYTSPHYTIPTIFSTENRKAPIIAMANPLSEAQAHLRIARPTDSISALLPFYVDGLGFELKLTFDRHEGFDGVLLAMPSSSSAASPLGYHLEFTQHETHRAGRAPTQDNLLVFYVPGETQYQSAVARMKGAGFEPVVSFNPYWDRCGTTFEDPDGYRVVIANRESPL
ncbi:hypothetical protein F5Y14DRAFT_407905 [Nemania sp. NC0429]|nr:hypothetical protein F5Y14DRAFT_407905 [Nemania sp. NC0429]